MTYSIIAYTRVYIIDVENLEKAEEFIVAWYGYRNPDYRIVEGDVGVDYSETHRIFDLRY
jgi:hypothetical protein